MPYWRLSGFYFFYFASIGAFVPYWNLYLKHLDFSPTETGIFIGTVMLTKIIAPNIWGWIADHTGKRMAIVRTGCLFAALSYTGILFGQQFLWMWVVMVCFSFFWNAALPQFEATTMNHLGEQPQHYSGIRLWGSVGFVIAVVVLGYVLEHWTSIATLPWFVLGLLITIWLSSLLVPETAAGHLSLDHEPLRIILRKPAVLGLLLACFCMQVSHGPYYAIYSRYMESYGYSVGTISELWAIGVIAEVVIFIAMAKLLKHYHLSQLLSFSLLIAVLRWLLIAVIPESLPIMVFAQLLHAASFGIYHATAIRLIHQHFTGRHQGKGQALYSAISFGAGGAVGSIYSGIVWDYWNRPMIFIISAGFSLLGVFFIRYYTHQEILINKS
ncbi:MAG: MFS transporter [Gammaproteobacteria bacterium]|nr:MFS transporter [Gammaproteobacteria bacterium]